MLLPNISMSAGFLARRMRIDHLLYPSITVHDHHPDGADEATTHGFQMRNWLADLPTVATLIVKLLIFFFFLFLFLH